MKKFAWVFVVVFMSAPVFAQQASSFKITGEINKEVVFSKELKSKQDCGEGIVRNSPYFKKTYSLALSTFDPFNSLNRSLFHLVFFEEELVTLRTQKSVTISTGGIVLWAFDGSELKKYNQYVGHKWGSRGCEVSLKLENGIISGSIGKCSLGADAEFPFGKPIAEVTGTFNCKDNSSNEVFQ